MSATAGLSLNQVSRDSLLRVRRDFFFAPTAANDAALVASMDPSTLSAGNTLTLLTLSNALMLRRARRVTLTLNDDDAGGGLTITVKITGQRWGQLVSEVLTVTCTGTNDTTGTSVNVYDEVTEVKVLSVTADAGDDLTMGLDGTSFGLDFPIDNLADVQLLINTSTNTEAAATAVSTSTVQVGAATGGVDAGGHYIKGITLAATDRWEVRYLASVTKDGTGAQGTFR